MKIVKVKKDNKQCDGFLGELLSGLKTLTHSSDTIRIMSNLSDYDLDLFEKHFEKAAKMVPSIRRFIEQQKKANKE